jgi:hypothetical protein
MGSEQAAAFQGQPLRKRAGLLFKFTICTTMNLSRPLRFCTGATCLLCQKHYLGGNAAATPKWDAYAVAVIFGEVRGGTRRGRRLNHG